MALRTYRPTSPGMRQLVLVDRSGLWKGAPVKMLTEGKTKDLRQAFARLELTNALIIDGAVIEVGFARAARNIPNIDVLPVQGINVYDILRRKRLVLTKAALEALEARFN